MTVSKLVYNYLCVNVI